MSSAGTSGGLGPGPGEGEALWFNGALGVLRATADQTEGRYTVMELLAPKGFGSPLHIHRNEDEFFVVLSGEVRVQHGEDVVEAVAGSVVYGPRDVAHAFHVDSAEARLLCSSDPRESKGSSARAASRLGPWVCRLQTSSSPIGKRSWRSPAATTRNSLVHPSPREADLPATNRCRSAEARVASRQQLTRPVTCRGKEDSHGPSE